MLKNLRRARDRRDERDGPNEMEAQSVHVAPFLLVSRFTRTALIDSSKHLCATMRPDETLVLPVTHVHRPMEPFRSGSGTAHGRFTRHDRTVL